MIIGERGYEYSDQWGSCAGGGGGTYVLRKPLAGGLAVMLVAGGGGGAAESMTNTGSDGQHASTHEWGGSGLGEFSGAGGGGLVHVGLGEM